MADSTPSRIGQVNGAGSAIALFKDVFSGEVLTAFETNVIMKDKHMVRNITSGKSASFPATWKIGSGYHTPGAEILGRAVNHAERVITVDDLLVSDAFIANIDEAMNHFEVRSVYSTEMGRELAKTYDKNVLRNVILASRGGATVTGSPVGQQITDAAFTSSGTAITDAFFDAAQILDANDAPDSDRYGVLPVAQYYLAVQNTNALNADWGGAGSYSEARLPLVAGIPVFKSNNVPGSDDTSNTALPTKYRANYTNTKGVIFQKGAAGTVQLLDLAMESEYDVRRQGTLMLAKYAVGHGLLRPELAVELKTA